MSERRQKIESITFRSQCASLLHVGGYSISKIAKITGESYQRTKQICEQIKNENKHPQTLLAESRIAHDKAITDGIEIVQGRDDRIAELEGQIAEYEKWFSDHATVLATHRIGGYSFEEPKP